MYHLLEMFEKHKKCYVCSQKLFKIIFTKLSLKILDSINKEINGEETPYSGA